MAARRVPALALPVDVKAGVSFQEYEHRTPLLTITTGRPSLMVTLTLPERLEAGHVDFARQLACQAWAYAQWQSNAATGACTPYKTKPPRTCSPQRPTHGLVTRPRPARTSWPTGRR